MKYLIEFEKYINYDSIVTYENLNEQTINEDNEIETNFFKKLPNTIRNWFHTSNAKKHAETINYKMLNPATDEEKKASKDYTKLIIDFQDSIKNKTKFVLNPDNYPNFRDFCKDYFKGLGKGFLLIIPFIGVIIFYICIYWESVHAIGAGILNTGHSIYRKTMYNQNKDVVDVEYSEVKENVNESVVGLLGVISGGVLAALLTKKLLAVKKKNTLSKSKDKKSELKKTDTEIKDIDNSIEHLKQQAKNKPKKELSQSQKDSIKKEKEKLIKIENEIKKVKTTK